MDGKLVWGSQHLPKWGKTEIWKKKFLNLPRAQKSHSAAIIYPWTLLVEQMTREGKKAATILQF